MRARFDDAAFVAAVRANVAAQGCTRREFAARAGLDETVFSRMLNRVTAPSLDTVVCLCAFLDLNPMSFREGTTPCEPCHGEGVIDTDEEES